MSAPQRFVAGFCFHDDDVVLIEKQRPAWQKGFWNGVGGHVEAGESDTDAMRREFREETGADVDGWEHFATLTTDHGSIVVFFRAFPHRAPTLSPMTDEAIGWFSVFGLPRTIPNLHWLVPMALHEKRGRGMPFAIAERTPDSATEARGEHAPSHPKTQTSVSLLPDQTERET